MGTTPSLYALARMVWHRLLAYDNQIFGLVLALLGLDSWRQLVAKLEQFYPYLIQGIVTLPMLGLTVIAFSTLYLTAISFILLTARQPIARYETFAPNLLAVIAGFGVYAFSLLPPPKTHLVNLAIPLLLLVVGSLIVLIALCYLRRGFTVTPQARLLVANGPYRLVRHPMYVGNILSLAGLGLMVGTAPALALSVVACALQVCRAHYEEKLLMKNIPGYADYKARTGAFIPRLRMPAAKLMTLTFLACAASGVVSSRITSAAGPQQNPAAAITSPRSPVVKVNEDETCANWHKKALAGEWFTTEDTAAFVETEGTEEALLVYPSCKAFFALQNKCDSTYIGHLAGEVPLEAVVSAIENTAGCKSIIGFDNMCGVMRELAESGKSMSKSRKKLLADCADDSLVDSTGNFIRPAL